MNSPSRLTPDERREVIVAAACRLTTTRGDVYAWTRQDVADECETPTSIDTVKHYFTMPDLRETVRQRQQK